MTYKEYIDWLEEKLIILSTSKKILFGLLCAKRLYPNYEFFKRKVNFGNEFFIKNTLEEIKNYLVNPKCQTLDLDKLLIDIDEIIPDTDDYGEIYASHALDASGSVEDLLKFISSKDSKYIIRISKACIDTIFMHIQDKFSPNQTIIHPLYVKELQVQKKHISYLVGLDTIRLENVNLFLEMFEKDNLISLDYLQ